MKRRLLNSFGVRVISLLNNISVWWHVPPGDRPRPAARPARAAPGRADRRPDPQLLRFQADRLRIFSSLVQPVLFLLVLFLLVLGTGLSRLAGRGMPPGISFSPFIYPGVLCLSVLSTSLFSAGSIVWDREFGFLREMRVAPVSRSALVIGKCLGARRWRPSRES